MSTGTGSTGTGAGTGAGGAGAGTGAGTGTGTGTGTGGGTGTNDAGSIGSSCTSTTSKMWITLLKTHSYGRAARPVRFLVMGF